MSVKTDLKNGNAIYVCPACGKEFTSTYVDPATLGDGALICQVVQNKILCPSCAKIAQAQEKAEDNARRRSYFEKALVDTGIPENFVKISVPYVRNVSEWIWHHRNQNFLLGGETGAGKTSSSCFVAKILLQDSIFKPDSRRTLNISYLTRSQFLARATQSLTASEDHGESFSYWEEHCDLLILDEMVGKSGDEMLSPRAQDLFQSLIDNIYSGKLKMHLWMLGNFYAGSIERLFADPEPLMRRIHECFTIAIIKDGNITEGITAKKREHEEIPLASFGN